MDGRKRLTIVHCLFQGAALKSQLLGKTTRREEGKTLGGREKEVMVPGQTDITNHCQKGAGREEEL